MKREEQLSLDEFVTAPRKQAQDKAPANSVDLPATPAATVVPALSEPGEASTEGDGASRMEARKALRRLKRERMKGVQSFANVHLDRETKKRLKLASFTSDVSMQSIMETAITKFLDDNGF